MADQESEIDKIKGQLNSLELRVRKLESALAYKSEVKSGTAYEKKQVSAREEVFEAVDGEEKGLESRIGRIGLAWMGNIVLLLGIIFLVQYLVNLKYLAAGVILGFITALLIYFFSDYLKKTNRHLSLMFKLNAQVVLFYVTLRLHFFSADPLITGKILSVFLLLMVVAFPAYLSIRNRSQPFAALAVLFVLSAAIISDSFIIILPLIVLTAVGAIYYLIRFDWKALAVATIFLTYASLLIWMLGDPVIGHPVHLITQKHLAVACLFSLGVIYSAVLLSRKVDKGSDDFLAGLAITNGILFSGTLLFISLGFFTSGYVYLFAGITVACLIFSIVLHSSSDWTFGSAFYALYGFMAMSIALYGLVGIPRVYFLLSVQSLLVVSMALWFRNRLIVIMNSLLFAVILVIYLLLSRPGDEINFSFALVALISARVINWKKSRLQIKTDLIRNLYMIEGFVMVLFSLIHAVPKQFVTLSWTMAALVYFLVSIILRNVKYRFMALGTMVCAAIYLFMVDLARIEIVYRVLALLFLAAISIGISIYYTNRIKKSDS